MRGGLIITKKEYDSILNAGSSEEALKLFGNHLMVEASVDTPEFSPGLVAPPPESDVVPHEDTPHEHPEGEALGEAGLEQGEPLSPPASFGNLG